MSQCIYCHKSLDGSEAYQVRTIYIPELLANLKVWLHDSCYQARLRWQQEDQL